MTKIVVGYDGRQPARGAAGEAATLARALGGEFHLVRVLDDTAKRQGMTTPDMDREAEDEARLQNEELLGKGEADGGLADLLDGVTTESHVYLGSPSDALVDYATSIEADLIVVGNRRVQGLNRVLGSVAIQVLRHAPCSVYVAHTA